MIVNVRGPLEPRALRILREIPGLTASAEPATGTNCGVDAIVEFAGTNAHVAVEIKQRANAATAWQLVHQAQTDPRTPLLLIAEATTVEAREILQRNGIGVIDGLGNAQLQLPGLLLHVERDGRVARPTGKLPTRLRGKAGVAAQTLLLSPDQDWHVRDLEHGAGISRGLAHRVLERLEREGVVASVGSGPNRLRHITDPTALLDLLAEEHADRPRRIGGYSLGRSPRELIAKVNQGLAQRGIEHAITGAAAASLEAPLLTATPIIDAWITEAVDPEDALDAIEAEPASDGHNVVLLQAKDDTPLALRESIDDISVVNRFRLYLDLLNDPHRGREQADHLRQEVIGF